MAPRPCGPWCSTALDILQASLEAIAYRLALIYQRLTAVATTERLLVSGGGSASPAWLQILADILEHPLVVTAEPEAASRGAALLALEALGVWEDVGGANPPADSGNLYAAPRP